MFINWLMVRAKKLAKRMLKKYPKDYQLWNAYAQIEIKAGKVQEGENVYTTALSFVEFALLDKKQTLHVDMLFLSFVELVLSQGKIDRSVSIIVAYVERRAPPGVDASQEVKPMQILKTRKSFEMMSIAKNQEDRSRLIAVQVCDKIILM
jgi:hypothetical protein